MSQTIVEGTMLEAKKKRGRTDLPHPPIVEDHLFWETAFCQIWGGLPNQCACYVTLTKVSKRSVHVLIIIGTCCFYIRWVYGLLQVQTRRVHTRPSTSGSHCRLGNVHMDSCTYSNRFLAANKQTKNKSFTVNGFIVCTYSTYYYACYITLTKLKGMCMSLDTYRSSLHEVGLWFSSIAAE